MDSRWEERFETSMKEYLDNIVCEVGQGNLGHSVPMGSTAED